MNMKKKEKGKFTVYASCNGIEGTTCEVESLNEAVCHMFSDFDHNNIVNVAEVYRAPNEVINILLIYKDNEGDTLTTHFVVVENK